MNRLLPQIVLVALVVAITFSLLGHGVEALVNEPPAARANHATVTAAAEAIAEDNAAIRETVAAEAGD